MMYILVGVFFAKYLTVAKCVLTLILKSINKD